MLTTGIEVEARPPGKKVKRLSLLSGGERSLTAMAMLVAIFRARPSPFYVLDEIEAALDDANLRRLISLLEELRETSQLIVITHQKPTMEVADALYGVSMRGDGITTVISPAAPHRAADPSPSMAVEPAVVGRRTGRVACPATPIPRREAALLLGVELLGGGAPAVLAGSLPPFRVPAGSTLSSRTATSGMGVRIPRVRLPNLDRMNPWRSGGTPADVDVEAHDGSVALDLCSSTGVGHQRRATVDAEGVAAPRHEDAVERRGAVSWRDGSFADVVASSRRGPGCRRITPGERHTARSRPRSPGRKARPAEPGRSGCTPAPRSVGRPERVRRTAVSWSASRTVVHVMATVLRHDPDGGQSISAMHHRTRRS